jgi:SAM-dependent methyltransferase
MTALPSPETQLRETRAAFDDLAPHYEDGNVLMRRMRRTVWRVLEREFPAAGRLLDLGCGPGTDAVHLATRGHQVVAVDWSPRMVATARDNAAAAGVAQRVTPLNIGIHDELPAGPFDGIYSNFGPLNCVPDLRAVSAACAARLHPGGKLIACVMGRHVPWEKIHNRLRGEGRRSSLRRTRGPVPVSLGGHTVWTTYYTPRELFGFFAGHFRLVAYRALGLFLPPPYLVSGYQRWPAMGALLGVLDDALGGAPLLRDAGDHFLMTMTRLPDLPLPGPPARGNPY